MAGAIRDCRAGGDPVIGHSEIALKDISLPQAVELSYIHSRDYQTALKTCI